MPTGRAMPPFVDASNILLPPINKLATNMSDINLHGHGEGINGGDRPDETSVRSRRGLGGRSSTSSARSSLHTRTAAPLGDSNLTERAEDMERDADADLEDDVTTEDPPVGGFWTEAMGLFIVGVIFAILSLFKYYPRSIMEPWTDPEAFPVLCCIAAAMVFAVLAMICFLFSPLNE